MSAVSAMAGISLGGTNEPTSISFSPAAASAEIQAFFASVGIRWCAFCRPSRGPTSQMWTSMAAILLGQALLEAADRDCRADADEREDRHDLERGAPISRARGHPGDQDRERELRRMRGLHDHAVGGANVLRGLGVHCGAGEHG